MVVIRLVYLVDVDKMKDEELVKAYTVSIFIISLLDEYGKLERRGSFARVYNTIIKKNSVFQKQIEDLEKGRVKKISKKAKFFSIAIGCSIIAWDNATAESKKIKISAGTSVSNLYKLNEELLTRIYGLRKEDFVKIHKLSQAGVTLNSCGMATILTKNAQSVIDEYFQNDKG